MPVSSIEAVQAERHPSLVPAAFVTEFDEPLGELATPEFIRELFALGAQAPLTREEAVRADVRDMLRHGGYKPTGRGKPASEYLVRAAGEGALGTINLAVDACNAVSLHSGLPISVVDLDLTQPPFRVAVADEGEAYVFNPGGQEIALSGLVCLFDSVGPCANAVRDSQRTKTRPETMRTLSVIWGVAAHRERLATTVNWYRNLLHEAGGSTTDVEIRTD